MQTPTTAGYFLAPQQAHVWLLQQRIETQLSCQIAVRIGGSLEVSRLQAALDELIARHEMLRTIFRRQAGMKIPFQVILDTLAAEWVVSGTDTAATVEASLAEQAGLPFRLEQGPIVRALLRPAEENQHLLILTLPALCADRASLLALVKELFEIYGNPSGERGDEPLRYVQFAQWQGELLQESEDETAVEGRKFWAERAEAGEQKVELPDEIAAETGSASDVVVELVDSALLGQIQAIAAGGSNSDVLLAAWQALLSRLTGRARLAVGVTLAGREYEELAGAIGPIAKMVPIHARFDDNPSFVDAVEQAKAAVEEAAGCQEYLDPAIAFTEDAAIGFSYTALDASFDVAGLHLSVVREQSASAGCKLSLNCVESAGRLELRFQFAATRYQRSSVQELSKRFITLLSAAVANSKQPVARLALLEEAQIQRYLYLWNSTEAPYPQRPMHALIAEQAQRTPDRLAVRFQDRTLSYAELNMQANQLAHYLRGLGVGANSLVGLCVARSERMIVAVLAIHKAGGAYVPLAADYPQARLAKQLEGAVLLITEADWKAQMPDRFGEAAAGPVICLDSDAVSWADASKADPVASSGPDDLAYVIYTSGSTGVPKGVGVRHRNLVNYSWAIIDKLKLDNFPEGLQFATVSTLLADLGNTCIYPALLSGGGLHVIPYEVATDSASMAEYQAKYPVDVLKIVPSHLAALLQSPDRTKLLPLKYLITGGEALTRSLVAEIESCGAGCRLINHYGPTETTVGSLVQPLSDLDAEQELKLTIPIGKPIANTQVYVLDALLQVVPEGVAGELYIAGAGVSAGYIGQPKLTAERFLPNPFVEGSTMYRTGDLVRYVTGTDGAVEFLGRADDQVKVRGFRIELGEVEAALAKQPGVKQVVVMAREDGAGGDKQLVGYVVASAGNEVTGQNLREQLRPLLPEYMIPSAVIVLEKLPLTPNGKIDRKALPDANAESFQRPYVAPSTPTERAIAGIWQEVLHRQNVSADADFFELGGHSLSATQVVSRIRQQCSVGIALRVLFESPVLRDLARAVDAAAPTPETVAGPIRRAARDAYRVPAK
jgi:amino acid adenylation domain-containing protein